MVLHVTVVYTGQRNRLGRNAPEHPSLIEPKYSKQDTPGACEKNLILSVKTAHAFIFQCLEKLTVQKPSSFYVFFHNRVLLQGRLCSATDRLSYTVPQGHTDLRRTFRSFVTAWHIYLQTCSVLTLPPSALYSFSSPSRSLAKPKSVIFTWFGDFTRTFLAARSLWTSLLSSRYIIPCRKKNSTIMLISLTWFWRANIHWWHAKWLVQLWVFTMRKWPRGEKFNIFLAQNRGRIRWPWVSPVWMIL